MASRHSSPAGRLAWTRQGSKLELRLASTGPERIQLLLSLLFFAVSIALTVASGGRGMPLFAIFDLMSLGGLYFAIGPFVNRSEFVFGKDRFVFRARPMPRSPDVTFRVVRIEGFTPTALGSERFSIAMRDRQGVERALGLGLVSAEEAALVAEELTRILVVERQARLEGPFRSIDIDDGR